mmetsp:Transcript_6332/g.12240  ORF Transcript_6332/g.12240 Transcript_6332/m.12240 type:complete len:215 (-) Transcript_6332:594-1238(-)
MEFNRRQTRSSSAEAFGKFLGIGQKLSHLGPRRGAELFLDVLQTEIDPIGLLEQRLPKHANFARTSKLIRALGHLLICLCIEQTRASPLLQIDVLEFHAHAFIPDDVHDVQHLFQLLQRVRRTMQCHVVLPDLLAHGGFGHRVDLAHGLRDGSHPNPSFVTDTRGEGLASDPDEVHIKVASSQRDFGRHLRVLVQLVFKRGAIRILCFELVQDG